MIIKDYCEKKCNKHENMHDNLNWICGISNDIIIENKNEIVKKMKLEKYKCKCNDFLSNIVAFTMDFYSNAFYILLSNAKLYRIEKINNEWQVTNRVNLKHTVRDFKDRGLIYGACAIKYDSINQRIIIADRFSIKAIYML